MSQLAIHICINIYTDIYVIHTARILIWDTRLHENVRTSIIISGKRESGNINWAYFPSRYISLTNQPYKRHVAVAALVYYECHFRIFENSIVDVMSAEIKICHYPQPKSMVRSLGLASYWHYLQNVPFLHARNIIFPPMRICNQCLHTAFGQPQCEYVCVRVFFDSFIYMKKNICCSFYFPYILCHLNVWKALFIHLF